MKILLKNEKEIEGRCLEDGENRIVVTFTDGVPDPEEVTGFRIYRENGELLFDAAGFETVYKTLTNGYILSNDGSVYVPPTDPEPEPAYEPTLDDLKAAKKAEIGAECEQVITRGVDVQLPDGVEHFSLTSNDQINLIGSQAAVAAGEQQIAYHEDGKPCRYYTPEEINLIIQQTMFWIGYHRTYCNSINMWIKGTETKEELGQITYGADVPVEYQSEVLKDYLERIKESAGDET